MRSLLAATLAFLALPTEAAAAPPCPSPSILVRKARGVVELTCDGALRGRFPATFGASPVGPKEREGDEKTPEGRYRVTSKVVSRRFHLFLGLSYPNAEDRRRAAARGIRRPGRGIGIHGSAYPRLARMWTFVAHATGMHRVWGPTDGCIGLTNGDIETLWAAVEVGTPVQIVP